MESTQSMADQGNQQGQQAQPEQQADDQHPEPDYHMPDELLLTFTSGTETPFPDDPLVEELCKAAGMPWPPLQQAFPVRSGAAGHPQPPLTLRLPLRPAPENAGGHAHLQRSADGINARRAELRRRDLSLTSAMPNWILSGANGSGKPTGGPGTEPRTAMPADWELRVPPAGAWPPAEYPGLARTADQGVTVAILDTWPGRQALAEALGTFPKNALLRELVEGNVITEWRRPPVPPVVAARQNVEMMEDHGLFVASIIHRIAPHARIHALRVLDDTGGGHTHLLLDALDECIRLAHQTRLVVNMSMYLQIPQNLWGYWFGGDGALTAGDLDQKAELIDALDEAIEQRITLLLDAGAVVVAAAGNDGLHSPEEAPRTDGHPQPRLPADYDMVLCVVAADREATIAAYSNRADVPFTGNCVATYGGQGKAEPKQMGEAGDWKWRAVVPKIPGTVDGYDGVVGLHTGCGEASGGWAYWSGTSFATPIISGIAANLLARNEMARRTNAGGARITPRQVMRAILRMSTPKDGTGFGCPYLPVQQHPEPRPAPTAAQPAPPPA